jgi:uncharacterized protein (DUF2235 family)
MPKNIVILLDGTSNEITVNRSNVLKLYLALENDERQVVYYSPGVGTFGAEDAWLRFWCTAVEIWGMATGWGLDQNIKDAYRFLVENYDRDEASREGELRDRIYIFGFSRGAYSARVLAGFIHAIGLIEPRQLNLLNYAFRGYKAITENREPTENTFQIIRSYERVLKALRPPIRFLGLFDTVATVIESGRYLPQIRTHAFTHRNLSVESVRHAVSIDERRTMFRPQLWQKGQEYWGNPFNKRAAKIQDSREMWFSGVHADVGGGYTDEQRLASLPLKWMIEQSEPLGLHFRLQKIRKLLDGQRSTSSDISADAVAPRHNSMNWAWAILEFIPRLKPRGSKRPSVFGLTLPLFEWRDIPSGALVHASVKQRIDTEGRRPPNLPLDCQFEEN